MNNRSNGKSTIQKMLDQNSMLIQAIVRYQNSGRAKDAFRYQQLLHRNLVYLASLANNNLLQQLNDMVGLVFAIFQLLDRN
ncbi:unnamed protein product [Anisakis simplex]|uniref:SSXT domain-containing protein n=1 Tax=Anisakis simplex TaxID=6269 RepID=A0A0M3JXQ4_ANISI|nr:unnamed protein product [Anisakis simplex]